MKFRLMTPGPTPVPDDTLADLAKPVFFHRTPEFRAILGEVAEDLKYVFQTKHPVIVITGSGNASDSSTGAVAAAGASANLAQAARIPATRM